MKFFVYFNLIIGTFGCTYYDYYEFDVDARDQSGANRGRGYSLFFPEEGGIKFGYELLIQIEPYPQLVMGWTIIYMV